MLNLNINSNLDLSHAIHLALTVYWNPTFINKLSGIHLFTSLLPSETTNKKIDTSFTLEDSIKCINNISNPISIRIECLRKYLLTSIVQVLTGEALFMIDALKHIKCMPNFNFIYGIHRGMSYFFLRVTYFLEFVVHNKQEKSYNDNINTMASIINPENNISIEVESIVLGFIKKLKNICDFLYQPLGLFLPLKRPSAINTHSIIIKEITLFHYFLLVLSSLYDVRDLMCSSINHILCTFLDQLSYKTHPSIYLHVNTVLLESILWYSLTDISNTNICFTPCSSLNLPAVTLITVLIRGTTGIHNQSILNGTNLDQIKEICAVLIGQIIIYSLTLFIQPAIHKLCISDGNIDIFTLSTPYFFIDTFIKHNQIRVFALELFSIITRDCILNYLTYCLLPGFTVQLSYEWPWDLLDYHKQLFNINVEYLELKHNTLLTREQQIASIFSIYNDCLYNKINDIFILNKDTVQYLELPLDYFTCKHCKSAKEKVTEVILGILATGVTFLDRLLISIPNDLKLVFKIDDSQLCTLKYQYYIPSKICNFSSLNFLNKSIVNMYSELSPVVNEISKMMQTDTDYAIIYTELEKQTAALPSVLELSIKSESNKKYSILLTIYIAALFIASKGSTIHSLYMQWISKAHKLIRKGYSPIQPQTFLFPCTTGPQSVWASSIELALVTNPSIVEFDIPVERDSTESLIVKYRTISYAITFMLKVYAYSLGMLCLPLDLPHQHYWNIEGIGMSRENNKKLNIALTCHASIDQPLANIETVRHLFTYPVLGCCRVEDILDIGSRCSLYSLPLDAIEANMTRTQVLIHSYHYQFLLKQVEAIISQSTAYSKFVLNHNSGGVNIPELAKLNKILPIEYNKINKALEELYILRSHK